MVNYKTFKPWNIPATAMIDQAGPSDVGAQRQAADVSEQEDYMNEKYGPPAEAPQATRFNPSGDMMDRKRAAMAALRSEEEKKFLAQEPSPYLDAIANIGK